MLTYEQYALWADNQLRSDCFADFTVVSVEQLQEKVKAILPTFSFFYVKLQQLRNVCCEGSNLPSLWKKCTDFMLQTASFVAYSPPFTGLPSPLCNWLPGAADVGKEKFQWKTLIQQPKQPASPSQSNQIGSWIKGYSGPFVWELQRLVIDRRSTKFYEEKNRILEGIGWRERVWEFCVIGRKLELD